MSALGAWARVAAAVVARPRLVPTAVSALWALRRPRWFASPPFLPTPDRRWMRWRLVTVYGDDRAPDPGDVVDWLEWRRRWAAASGS